MFTNFCYDLVKSIFLNVTQLKVNLFLVNSNLSFIISFLKYPNPECTKGLWMEADSESPFFHGCCAVIITEAPQMVKGNIYCELSLSGMSLTI